MHLSVDAEHDTVAGAAIALGLVLVPEDVHAQANLLAVVEGDDSADRAVPSRLPSRSASRRATRPSAFVAKLP